jgi:hypothetical protein
MINYYNNPKRTLHTIFYIITVEYFTYCGDYTKD